MDEQRRLEAEQRYVAGNETLKGLADGMGLPLSTIKRWCKAGDWVKKRQKAQKRAMRKAVTRATDKRARELARLFEASDAMERALVMSAQAFAAAMAETPADIVDGKFRAGNLASVAHAIGRQTETRMLISGVMAAADREKIDLLKRKQDAEEQKARQDAEGGGLVIRLEESGEAPIIE